MADSMETYRGVVYPWNCDHLGHMNVQHYVAMFDQAGYHLMAALGMSHDYSATAGHAQMDVQHTIKYKNEQRVGSLVTVHSGIVDVGAKTFTMLHRMTNTETGVEAATSEIVLVNVDLATRRSAEFLPEVRASLEAHLVERDS
jgi:acyl-CoA thioester hydrolase